MNCAEGEWWDEFLEMWGDVFGRTEKYEAERNDCTLEEWRALEAGDETLYLQLAAKREGIEP